MGYAGRLVPEKGLLVLAEALAALAGAWRLLLVGTGPPERDLLERFFDERRLLDRITFVQPGGVRCHARASCKPWMCWCCLP